MSFIAILTLARNNLMTSISSGDDSINFSAITAVPSVSAESEFIAPFGYPILAQCHACSACPLRLRSQLSSSRMPSSGGSAPPLAYYVSLLRRADRPYSKQRYEMNDAPPRFDFRFTAALVRGLQCFTKQSRLPSCKFTSDLRPL